MEVQKNTLLDTTYWVDLATTTYQESLDELNQKLCQFVNLRTLTFNSISRLEIEASDLELALGSLLKLDPKKYKNLGEQVDKVCAKTEEINDNRIKLNAHLKLIDLEIKKIAKQISATEKSISGAAANLNPTSSFF